MIANNNEPLDKDVINKKYAIKIIALTIAKILDGALEGLTDIFKKEKTLHKYSMNKIHCS
ncbi:hypothetical protein [Clostridium sp.]|jgi:hypothetical protein|uniref:hypothetical protein n=1 Tax=Clostridium sp. TaxID=1506 RepID=UPI002589E87B|nr:hypothetical protein [Clostridium sp.]MDF2505744.1 hypothetical protein [Clostridium sp.]